MSDFTDVHTDKPPLSRYHAGMLKLVSGIADGEIKRNVWDTDPPAVWFVERSKTALGHPSLAASELPLIPEIWEDRHGSEVLEALAEHLAPIMRRPRSGAPARRPIDAVVFVGESWTLHYPDDATAEQVEQAHLFAEARGIADHPWGVEAKSVIAVGADGWCYNAVRRRPTGDGPAFAEPPGGGIAGRYPSALANLLAALRARP